MNVISKIRPPGGYEWLLPEDERDFGWLHSLDGSPRREQWRAPKVKVLATDDAGRLRKQADLPWVGSEALVLRPRAVRALGEVLLQYGELLPLDSGDEEPLVLFNILTVVDALDEARSDIVRFRDGRIMDIRGWHLREAAIAGLEVFNQWSSILYSEQFKRRVEDAGLTGLGGRIIWPRPDGPT